MLDPRFEFGSSRERLNPRAIRKFVKSVWISSESSPELDRWLRGADQSDARFLTGGRISLLLMFGSKSWKILISMNTVNDDSVRRTLFDLALSRVSS